MRAEIIKLPDGTFTLKIPSEELETVKEKIREREELNDRELTIAREFELI